MAVQVERKTFNVEEYYRMLDAGILTEDDRVELIGGEILMMTPIGTRHAACVDRINSVFHRLVGGTQIVRIQNPIRLNDMSEPQPDVALLKPRQDYYAQFHPTASDVLLIIEVADQSLEFDRDIKIPLYAKAGIPEVWLVDLRSDLIELYSDLVGETYSRVQKVVRGETLRCKAVDLTVPVDAILG